MPKLELVALDDYPYNEVRGIRYTVSFTFLERLVILFGGRLRLRSMFARYRSSVSQESEAHVGRSPWFPW